MKNKWIRRLLLLTVILLLTSWSATYVYADNDNTTSQTTAQIEVTEASEASDNVAQDAITTTEENLSSHVYVINNREIVTEETWKEMNSLQDAATETASSAGTVTASVKVASLRLIVVDENDTIIEIWSNTTGTQRSSYSLRTKEQSVRGSDHSLTQEILAQYNRLLGEVDWTGTGQAYSITTAGYVN